jgi:molybdopterin/thiamine biosynthesis adenylyltransferase
MKGIGRVTLVDRDTYEERNLLVQNMDAADVGQPKALVQARRLRQVNPALCVLALPAAVEDVPPGRLRSDVILACVDSRRARQSINEVALHLGAPWIDAGVSVVDGSARLARVAVYAPGPEEACLECAWDETDYERLEQTYSCAGAHAAPPPTGAPAGLGALAAALQALECEALTSGVRDRAGRQLLLDATHHVCHETRFLRQSGCRLFEHRAWAVHRIREAPGEITLGGLLGLAREPGAHADGDWMLRVEGRRFVRSLTCCGCGSAVPWLGLAGASASAPAGCPRCGGPLIATGFDMTDRLPAREAAAAALARSLESIGLRPGDIVRLEEANHTARFEIGGDPGVP